MSTIIFTAEEDLDNDTTRHYNHKYSIWMINYDVKPGRFIRVLNYKNNSVTCETPTI